LAEAEHEFLRAIEMDPQNAQMWIAAGCYFAARGNRAKAEAHYEKVATLTPAELNRFIDGGWWVIGPYPNELRQFCPPEVEPDPSRPTHVVDPITGLSDEPQPWVHIPTGKLGAVNLRGIPEYREGNCYYALSYVHSPDDRSVLLLVSKDQPLRVWVNGELTDHGLPSEYSLHPSYASWHRLPVYLKKGRNTILVKTALPTFTLRIGDSVRDRTELLAEQERFTESARNAGLMEITANDLLTSIVPFWYATILAAEAEHVPSYERICAELVQIPNPDLLQKFVIPFACAQRPNASFDMHAERLVSHVEEFAAARAEPWTQLAAALVNYRAGKYDRARELLELSGWQPNVLPLQSLLQHQAGDAAAAAESLSQALKAGAEYESELHTSDRSDFQGHNKFQWWYDWAEYLILLLEAEQTIRGDSSESRALKLKAEETLAQRWTSSPELAAFDHAVLFSSIGPNGEPKYPATILCRSRQLAALGRWDEAAADFAKAAQLAPNDWQVQTAHASFLARRNDLAGATAEFDELVNANSGEKWWLQGRCIERELAGHTALLDAQQAEHPQAAILWRLRGEREIRLQNWEDALQAFSSGDPYWSHAANRAALHCLMGDYAAFAVDCQETEALLQQTLPDDPFTSILRGSIRTLHVANEQEARDLLKLAQEGHRNNTAARDAKLNLGLAYYRNGQYEAALHWLEEALAVPSWWAEHAPTWAALAMCHEKLGNHDEARRWLAKSAWWVEFTRQAAALPEFVGPYSLDYFQLLRSHLLHRQARTLITPADAQ
jgi:tetratricopeptide (TPR) repeat protein